WHSPFLQQVCDEYFTKMRRQVYQTPKSYLSFLQLYKAMYKEKINELKVKKKKHRIVGGGCT
ncbi:unnamed protein product, partial [Laminaria digitata]